MNDKKVIGTILYKEKIYTIEWDLSTYLVWIKDKKGNCKNYGNAKATNEAAAIDCAREMLRRLGF